MGRRATGDGLKDMERFAGNESEVVFPEWKQKLFDRMKFECGRVAVDVVEGRVKAQNVREGEDLDTVTQLVNMLIAQNRTGIKFDARRWPLALRTPPTGRGIPLARPDQLLPSGRPRGGPVRAGATPIGVACRAPRCV